MTSRQLRGPYRRDLALQKQYYRDIVESPTRFGFAESAPRHLVATFKLLDRNSEIVALRTIGVSAKNVARELRLSTRTVHRVIRDHPQKLELYDELVTEVKNRKPPPRVRYSPRLFYRACPHCCTGAVRLDWIPETGHELSCINCGWQQGRIPLEQIRQDSLR